MAKVAKISNGKEIIELKEDRNLFQRLVIICRTQPNIDFQQILGEYELSVVPRALFSMDGLMYVEENKSILMQQLEKLQKETTGKYFIVY